MQGSRPDVAVLLRRGERFGDLAVFFEHSKRRRLSPRPTTSGPKQARTVTSVRASARPPLRTRTNLTVERLPPVTLGQLGNYVVDGEIARVLLHGVLMRACGLPASERQQQRQRGVRACSTCLAHVSLVPIQDIGRVHADTLGLLPGE